MARVSRYNQDKLASSNVGVPTVDTSASKLVSDVAGSIDAQALASKQIDRLNYQNASRANAMSANFTDKMLTDANAAISDLNSAKFRQAQAEKQLQAQLDQDALEHHKFNFGMDVQNIANYYKNSHYDQNPTEDISMAGGTVDNAIVNKYSEYIKANGMNPNVAEKFKQFSEDVRLASIKDVDSWSKSKGIDIATDRAKADILRAKNEVNSNPESFALALKAVENNIGPRLAKSTNPVSAELMTLQAKTDIAKQHLDAAVKDRNLNVLNAALTDPLIAKLVPAKDLEGYQKDVANIHKEQENIAISQITDRMLDSKMSAEMLKGKALSNMNDYKAWTDLGITAKKMVRDVTDEINKTQFEQNPRVKAARMKALTTELKEANGLVNFADNQGDEVQSEQRRAARAIESAAKAMQAAAKRADAAAHRELKGNLSLSIFDLKEKLIEDPKGNSGLVSSGLADMESQIKALHKDGALNNQEFVSAMGHVRSAQSDLNTKLKKADKVVSDAEKLDYAFEVNNKIADIKALAANPDGNEEKIKKMSYDLLNDLGEKRRNNIIDIRSFNSKTNTLAELVGKGARQNGFLLWKEGKKDAQEREVSAFNTARSKVDFRTNAVGAFKTKSVDDQHTKIFDMHLNNEMDLAKKAKDAYESKNGVMPDARWQVMLNTARSQAELKAAMDLRNKGKK